MNLWQWPTSVAVGDFNGDGKQDLVASNNGSNALTVLLGNGNGTLQWVGNFDGAADVIAVAVGDFNADGKLDAVVVNELSNSVSIFLGNGDGTVVAPISYGIGVGQPIAQPLKGGEINETTSKDRDHVSGTVSIGRNRQCSNMDTSKQPTRV